MNETVIITLINVAIGSLAVKLLEYFTAKNKIEKEELDDYHQELAKEITLLREELKSCRKDVDDWQGKYYLRDLQGKP